MLELFIADGKKKKKRVKIEKWPLSSIRVAGSACFRAETTQVIGGERSVICDLAGKRRTKTEQSGDNGIAELAETLKQMTGSMVKLEAGYSAKLAPKGGWTVRLPMSLNGRTWIVTSSDPHFWGAATAGLVAGLLRFTDSVRFMTDAEATSG
jgi:hypothetical protein